MNSVTEIFKWYSELISSFVLFLQKYILTFFTLSWFGASFLDYRVIILLLANALRLDLKIYRLYEGDPKALSKYFPEDNFAWRLGSLLTFIILVMSYFSGREHSYNLFLSETQSFSWIFEFLGKTLFALPFWDVFWDEHCSHEARMRLVEIYSEHFLVGAVGFRLLTRAKARQYHNLKFGLEVETPSYFMVQQLRMQQQKEFLLIPLVVFFAPMPILFNYIYIASCARSIDIYVIYIFLLQMMLFWNIRAYAAEVSLTQLQNSAGE
jgi:hypothetical protein